MKLEFPSKFKITYPIQNLRYYSGNGKDIILNELIKACDGYCMYCGKNIYIDDKEEFNIEHSIEKSMDVSNSKFLVNCKYNLSIACPSCNQKYKTRMIEELPKELFDEEINCLSNECNEPCLKYKNLFDEYIKLNNIILQPNAINSLINNYSIEYSLIDHIFKPGQGCSIAESNFISNHIARFHLNRERYTESVLKICEDIINKIDILETTIEIKSIFKLIKKDRYNNILEKIFTEFLENNFTDSKVLYEYCKVILILSYL